MDVKTSRVVNESCILDEKDWLVGETESGGGRGEKVNWLMLSFLLDLDA